VLVAFHRDRYFRPGEFLGQRSGAGGLRRGEGEGIAWGRRTEAGSDMEGMTFRCNICDAQNALKTGGFLRDEPSCRGCGSSARLRAMMNALSMELFGVAVALSDFPVLKSVRGLGLSDNRECAAVLALKFDYRNTFYHQEPHLDVSEITSSEHGLYDFVLAGEVFEHVPPPVQNSLSGIFALLKPGGSW